MAIRKVTDPARKATDPCLLAHLKKEKIDKDFVEFEQDYAARGPGCSPYAKRYRDRKSGKNFLVCSGLPMCRADGTKLTPGWERRSGKFSAKTNLFTGTVADNGRIALSPTNKQPNGMRTSDTLAWRPQLYLGGIEVSPVTGPALLPVDPINPHLSDNTIEWDYGICKRRIRTIQGRLRERWIFYESPGADVRIIHNHTGKGLKLGEYAIDDDVELIPLEAFQLAEYPFEVSASLTVYPDAHEETSSVDGFTNETTDAVWATIRGAGGDSANDTDVELFIEIKTTTDQDDFDYIYRSHLVFDATALPDDCVITSAVLSIYGSSKVDAAPWAPDTCIFSSAPASDTEIVAGDHDSVGTTAFSNVITYAAFDTAGYNAYTLNATGLAAISKTIASKFSWYNKNYDADNSTPAWASNKRSAILGIAADTGSNKPRLVIEYIPSIVESIDVTLEVEAEAQRKLTLPILPIVEPEASLSRQIIFPLSVLVEPEAVGTFRAGLEKSISALVEVEAEAGRLLTFPLSSLVEAEAVGTFRAGLEGSVSATIEVGAEAGRLLEFPLSSLVEVEAVGVRQLLLPLSALIEVEAAGGKRIMFFSKNDVLINIQNEDTRVN